MLLSACVVAVGFLLAAWISARLSLRIMRRLGLEPVPVMLWLGLAERPAGPPRKERRRLGELDVARLRRQHAAQGPTAA